MRRIIFFALFGLLLSIEPAFAQRRHFVRPHGRIFVHRPHFLWHPARFARPHYYFDPFRFFVQDFTTAYSAAYQPFVPFTPTYFFVGSQSASHPQLLFKDGTAYTVADYWRVGDELHFVTVEDGGSKSVPRTAPFTDLDMQRTTDANSARGFRFRLRDEPVEQWLKRHHAQKAPRSSSKNRSR